MNLFLLRLCDAMKKFFDAPQFMLLYSEYFEPVLLLLAASSINIYRLIHDWMRTDKY